MLNAVEMLFEKRREVKNVTLPAMTRHIMDFTKERAVVSEKLALDASTSLVEEEVRYRCLVC